jgi:hypothetical protein
VNAGIATVNVVVGARNLGAYGTVVWPSVLQFASLAMGSWPAPAAKCNVRRRCRRTRADRLHLAGRETAGPDGNGTLSVMRFTALAPGLSTVRVADAILLRPNATEMTISSLGNGLVQVDVAPTPTPCPGVCPTDTPTPTFTPSPTRTPTATPGSVTPTPALGSVVVSLNPVSQAAVAGQNFTVNVDVSNVVNLGSYEFTLSFDEALIDAVSAVNGAFLQSGRTASACRPSSIP